MSKMQRTKGKQAELEVVKLAKECGFPDAARNQRGTRQVNGDIDGIPLYLEVRRRETIAANAWAREVEEAAPDGTPGVVAFRTSGEPWRAIVDLRWLLSLVNTASREDR